MSQCGRSGSGNGTENEKSITKLQSNWEKQEKSHRKNPEADIPQIPFLSFHFHSQSFLASAKSLPLRLATTRLGFGFDFSLVLHFFGCLSPFSHVLLLLLLLMYSMIEMLRTAGREGKERHRSYLFRLVQRKPASRRTFFFLLPFHSALTKLLTRRSSARYQKLFFISNRTPDDVKGERKYDSKTRTLELTTFPRFADSVMCMGYAWRGAWLSRSRTDTFTGAGTGNGI